MGSVEVDQDEECMEETSAHQLLSSFCPDEGGICSDPQVSPRVGNQYQVEIPPLATKSECFQLAFYPAYAEQTVDVENSIHMGLPIPIMWIPDVVDPVKHECPEFIGDTVDLGTTQAVGNEMDLDLPQWQQRVTDLESQCKSGGYIPVPGTSAASWSDIEQESFILGLYIFGKNLIQVKRFVGSKDMGDIQSFYYGKFFGSKGYRRWLECRKMPSRKCILGQRIFTGWRQLELLSRLVPYTPEECRNALPEVTKTFGEGKVSLEDYVSTLKAMVGLDVLIKAIGVGKGKHDLTGTAMEPIKTNPPVSTRVEVPIGKECSSLSPAEIIKYLTGDFRLSKARSNDLFWEAVWPRLLARGWHSEQPKKNSYFASKPSLVFLIPGVKKFSRSKLIKGNHYFDSVSDVLNKVVSDPRLLEFEIDAVDDLRVNEENSWKMNNKANQVGPSEVQRYRYLRPRVQDCTSKLTKFTVVDTSLINGEEPRKVRELKSLPVDTVCASSFVKLPKESDRKCSSEGPSDGPNTSDTISNDQEESHHDTTDDNKSGMLVDRLDKGTTLSEQGTLIGRLDSSNMLTGNCKGQCSDTLNRLHQEKGIKCRFSLRVESVRPNYLPPISKRRRLNACNRVDNSRCKNIFSVDPPSSKEEPRERSLSLEESNVVGTEAGPSQPRVSTSSSGKKSADEVGPSQSKASTSSSGKGSTDEVGPSQPKVSTASSEKQSADEVGPSQLKRSTSSLGKGSADENSACDLGGNSFDASTVSETTSREKPRQKALIDLNLQNILQDMETDEPFIAEVADSQDHLNMEGSSLPSESKQQHEAWARDPSGGKDNANLSITPSRRQSTRHRPPTTRVLEALESGFFDTRRRGRGTKALPCGNPLPRPRRRACDSTGVSNSGNVITNIVDSKVDGGDEDCSSNTDVVSKSQIQVER